MAAVRSTPTASPRLIHLADYGGIYSGSFIPMLIAVATAARNGGWSVELIFSDLSRGRDWLEDLERARIPYRFLDVSSRTGFGRWISWFAAETSGMRWQGHLTNAVAALLGEVRAPTILHTHFGTFDVAAAHAARKTVSTLAVWHGHSMRRPGGLRAAAGLVRYRLLARNVAAFLCVAPEVDAVIRRLVPSERVALVPNAVDAQRFAPATTDERSRARAKFEIAPEAHVLLHFGSHWLGKGGDIYLAAVKSLLAAGSPRDVKAITVGGEAARAAVHGAGLQCEVTVVEPMENVRELYAAADIFVSPSRSEGMPFALLEALSMGLPVVASDIPGHAFVAKAASACRLTSRDSHSVAASIRAVLDRDARESAREQAAARRWILEHMSLAPWAQRLMQIYERLLTQL
jgi:glycosyltransferase involved in cell wall biosynthesis